MDEQAGKGAIAITLLLLMSSLFGYFSQIGWVLDTDSNEVTASLNQLRQEAVSRGSTMQFADGNISNDLRPSLNDSTLLTHRPGQRIDEARLNVTAEGTQLWTNSSDGMLVLAPNSSFSETSVDANGRLRLNTSSGGSVPNAGTNNTQITLNSLWQGGNYSFDTFRIVCIGMSCGSITVQGGPLRIYANTIIIDQGAAIYADEMVWANSGQGSSTQRASNGVSPGAGGAGHGGTGGQGGSTSGGSGGINYGNGSEPGSSGGNVTFTNSNGNTTADATGGKGGGHVELIAANIWMNGTISANGGRGDDGAPPPSGTGPGGSGAGGGSGGSVIMMANNIGIGQNAILRANGGDGGDGARGAQAGIGIGMYNGGHGGGGGAGGIVMAVTTSGNLTNNGVMQASGGTGGSGGAPYGSGTTGSSGSNGGNGFAFTGTFAGWGGAPVYFYNGNYTSPIFGDLGMVSLNGQVSIPHTVSANNSIIATYSYTLDGNSWSDWLNFNLSGDVLPPHTQVQFRLWLSTTENSTTPTASAINYNRSNWYSIDDFSLGISNISTNNQFWYFQKDLGVARDITAIAGIGSTQIRSSVPTNATPTGSAWFHIMPPNFVVDSDIDISIGSTSLLAMNSSQFPAMGLTIEVNESLMIGNWPANPQTQNGSAGIAWSNLEITCSATGGFMGSFTSSHAVIPYELTTMIGGNGSMLQSINDYVNQTSNRWAEASFSTFPVTSSGSAIDTQSVTLDSLWLHYIDDIIPEVSNISFYVDGQPVTEARVGELVEIRVKVLGDESDATVEWHMEGLGGISSWPPSSLSTMAWDTLHNGYVAFYDTAQHSSEFGDSMALWLWLEDAAGNQRTPAGVGAWYETLNLKPVYPELDVKTVGGCDSVSVAICEAVYGTEIIVQASAVEDRSDLDVFVHVINPADATDEYVIPLLWHESSKVYDGSFILSYPDLGWWDIVFRVFDVNRNEGNWSTAAIDKLKLVDDKIPVEGNLIVGENPTASTTWSLNGEWESAAGDLSSSTVSINGPNGYLMESNPVSYICNDTGEISSYVALGGSETQGVGADNSDSSVTAIIHQNLNQTWAGTTLENISDQWGSIQNFLTKKDVVLNANPDIITILPLRDFTSSSTSSIQSNYPNFLDDLAPSGAQIYIGIPQLDPDFICHIGVGPAGCHSYGEYQMVREKSIIFSDIAESRPWVTLVPLSDDGPENVYWLDSNGDFTNEGHAALAQPFIDAIQGAYHSRDVTLCFVGLVDYSTFVPGTYEFEFSVIDGSGNEATDGTNGPDATMFIAPQDNILSLSIATPAPTNLHPGIFEVTYDSLCAIGCEMNLDVYLDGELVDTVHPTGGAGTYEVLIPNIGSHTITMTLSTPDWQVSTATDSLEVFATPPPSPDWHISCSSWDDEVTQIGIAYQGELGNLSKSSHYIDCAVTNSGEANGFVSLSNQSIVGPFDCDSELYEVTPSGRAEFHCFVEESDDVSGIYQLSLQFSESVDGTTKSIGGWETSTVLLSPRFEKEIDDDSQEQQQPEETNQEVAGKSPIGWIISAFVLLLVGIGAISLMFTIRERKDPVIGEIHEDSMFKDDKSKQTEKAELESIHPSLLEESEPLETSFSRSEEGLVENSTESIPSQVGDLLASYLDLPGGGEYSGEEPETVYSHPDGRIWRMEDGNKFRRIS